MTLYRYVKKLPKEYTFPYWIFSYIFLIIGTGLLVWTIWPILSFVIFTAPQFITIVSPIPETHLTTVSTKDKISRFAESGFLLASKTLTGTDYTNPNLWFPSHPQEIKQNIVNSYTISIPRLGINRALVVISGGDLQKSLIHYGGTGFPGEYGNSVVFGHSTLPQFFSPTDYKAIFSTLPDLKIGDTISVNFDGVTYIYTVYDMTVTMPDDLGSLEQKYDDSYFTLVTCVPPGTYAKRLNVKSKLQKI